MNDILNGLSDHYNWLPIYTGYVIYEYERYISLFSKYKLITVAPEAIEQCWMYHVLNIEHYHSYCIKRFGQVILYKPCNITINERNIELRKNREVYLREFGSPKYEMVWIYNMLDKVYHDRQKLMIIKFYSKNYKLTPTCNDTIKSIKETISTKSNILYNKIAVYIEGQSGFNISQLFRMYRYKESENLGFCKEKPLYDNFTLLDILHFGYNTLNVSVIN